MQGDSEKPDIWSAIDIRGMAIQYLSQDAVNTNGARDVGLGWRSRAKYERVIR